MQGIRLMMVAAMLVACGGAQPAPQGEGTPATGEGTAAPSEAADDRAEAPAGEPLGCNQAMACVIDCAKDAACIDTCKERIPDDSSAVLLIEFDNCIADAKLMACGQECKGDGPECGGCIQDACRTQLDACEADQPVFDSED